MILTDELKTIFPEQTKVFIIVRYVSRSKITRHLSILTIRSDENGRIYTEQWDKKVAQLLKLNMHIGPSHSGIIVKGLGMDMIACLVRNLSLALYNNTTSLYFQVL